MTTPELYQDPEEGSLDNDVFDTDDSSSAPTTASLEALQSVEQRELMDLIDRLRRAGLSSMLQLPQIVVCGDQSSGKSSVLEAITEIPFPKKESLCTRFATEISMRRDACSSISCKINPDDGREEGDKDKLRSFTKSIKDFHELPSLIDEATELMGLGPQRAFSRDVLKIDICGPDRPQLTLVDLPGLIHSSNKMQSDEDVELIKSLVEEYISEKRTIILAIVSAKNDYANQIILKTCRKYDPEGARTLGVITKPDFLRPDSENEQQWLDLAKNRDIYFRLGWHILKNRADGNHDFSFAQRDTEERAFFDSGNYKDLPKSMKGIATFRKSLSKLLFDHMKKELPDLKEELEMITARNCEELATLGKSRETLSDQRIYLAEISSSACDLLRQGVEGNYDSAFFGSIDPEEAVVGGQNAYRLRAVIQHLNIEFADLLRRNGRKYEFEKEAKEEAALEEGDVVNPAKSTRKRVNKPTKMTRQQAIQWVVQIMERSRGRELPGTFNPLLIGHLFQEQSENWERLARTHINAVSNTCDNFVLHVLDHIATPDVKARLENKTVLPKLKSAHDAALNELRLIGEDKKKHAITYNHYFTDTFQKIQQERYSSQIMKLTQQATVSVQKKTWLAGPGFEDKTYIDPEALQQGLKRTIEQDMTKFSAEQALDAHEAYYKDELKYFIGVVTKQAVERHLLSPLADILSPTVMARYSDTEIQSIAAEPVEAMQMRAHLEGKKKMFEDGQDAFCAAMGHII
ncbi:hypothetical protein Vi05172_g4091 [Venturia inaequalis]|nr:hypothetical protein Vi05172_g4091 [Venturia inaequalis]